jgi:hypothetical protein
MNTKKEMGYWLAAGAFLLITLIVLAGCSIANYGSLKRSREVTLAFKSNLI